MIVFVKCYKDKTNVQNGEEAWYLEVYATALAATYSGSSDDRYLLSTYTDRDKIGITSVQDGEEAWYSEVCAATLAATYGGSSDGRYLVST